MFPLYDESAPSLKPPFVTLALIFINVLVFAVVLLSGNFEDIVFRYGTIPSQIFEGKAILTLLTAIFLHGGIVHLAGNMWFLWIFGDNVEHNMGLVRFIIFYLLVGVIASLAHVFTAPSEYLDIPTIGASGAISGLLGGYVALFPRNRIKAFILLLFRPIFFYVPAYIYVGVWFFYQLLYINTPTMIAYVAHIGGFIAGMALVPIFRRRVVEKDYYKPPEVIKKDFKEEGI
jgi:membrane associated rhomboid family serine protease